MSIKVRRLSISFKEAVQLANFNQLIKNRN